MSLEKHEFQGRKFKFRVSHQGIWAVNLEKDNEEGE